MRHDLDLARRAAPRADAPRPEWGRLARAAARNQRLLAYSGIGVALALLGLVGGRAACALIWPLARQAFGAMP